MTIAELEARIWAATGRHLDATQMDEIVGAALEYAAELAPGPSRRVLRHSGDADLHPLIGVLAGAMLDPSELPVKMTPKAGIWYRQPCSDTHARHVKGSPSCR
jgi:hypothetical protein